MKQLLYMLFFRKTGINTGDIWGSSSAFIRRKAKGTAVPDC